MAKEYNTTSLSEVYESIANSFEKDITEKIVNLFIKNGLTYKIKLGYKNMYRIFCYIRKSKEALIINPVGKNFGPYELQIRIKNKNTLKNLETFSANLRNQILNNKDCKAPYCCNCGSEYQFMYLGKKYYKCHMLCDNFTFRNLKTEDIKTIISIIQDEIVFDMPRTSKSKKA